MTKETKGESIWALGRRKFLRDRLGVVSFLIVLLYFLVACAVFFGWLGQGWERLTPTMYAPLSPEHWFGTNINGQDIFLRAIYSTKTAFEVGLIVAVCSCFFGAILGCFAGFYSGTFLDELVIWLYGCLDSMPFYLFVAAVAFALPESPISMHIAMIATFWTGPCKVMRGQVMKIKNQDFIEAARAIGVPQWVIIFKHVLPNGTHIILVEISLIFVAAIKSEVILSFLGLGLKDGISWGLMISESAGEVTAGIFNNFLAASGFLFVLVMAFNQFSDALQDALDPKKVSS